MSKAMMLIRGAWLNAYSRKGFKARYCPDSEVRFILSLGAECAKAEALDAGEDVVGSFGPTEGLWVSGTGIDLGGDGSLELGQRAKGATRDGTLGEQAKEALDLIDP